MPVTECNYSESNDGKDMCDILKSNKKKIMQKAVGSHSDCKAADYVVQIIEKMVTLKGKCENIKNNFFNLHVIVIYLPRKTFLQRIYDT